MPPTGSYRLPHLSVRPNLLLLSSIQVPSWFQIFNVTTKSLYQPHRQPPICLRTSTWKDGPAFTASGKQSPIPSPLNSSPVRRAKTNPSPLQPNSLDHEERARKKAAREGHDASEKAQNLRGLRAKMYAEKRHKEKIQMRKQIKAHEERNVKSAAPDQDPANPVPAYLLDRSNPTSAKALSSAIKNKRAEKAARFAVPLPKVRGISEEEMFKVVNTGKKTHKKGWKRMVTKPTFVGQDFTRKLHPRTTPFSPLWCSVATG